MGSGKIEKKPKISKNQEEHIDSRFLLYIQIHCGSFREIFVLHRSGIQIVAKQLLSIFLSTEIDFEK